MLALVYGGALAVLVAVALASVFTDHNVAYFTREPAEALKRAGSECSGAECSYVGSLSNLGMLVWCAGAVPCFLAAFLASGPAGPRRSPFLYAGLLTTVLLADDMFLLHDHVYDKVIPRGSEAVVYGSYGLALAAYSFVFRDFLRRTDYGLIGVALAFFLVSLTFDRWYPGHHLFEDGSKFLGVVTWSVYFAGTAVMLLRRGRPAH